MYYLGKNVPSSLVVLHSCSVDGVAKGASEIKDSFQICFFSLDHRYYLWVRGCIKDKLCERETVRVYLVNENIFKTGTSVNTIKPPMKEFQSLLLEKRTRK